MARYTGPKSKIARKFGEPIYGPDKYLEKRNYPPGQHGMAKKRKKTSEYGTQLAEKQKVKYTYGVLERQFRKMYEKAVLKPDIYGDGHAAEKILKKIYFFIQYNCKIRVI